MGATRASRCKPKAPFVDRARACSSSPCFAGTWMVLKPKLPEHPPFGSPTAGADIST